MASGAAKLIGESGNDLGNALLKLQLLEQSHLGLF